MSDLGKVSEEGSLIKENVGTQNENKGQFEEETTFSFVGDAITLNVTGRDYDAFKRRHGRGDE